MGGELERRGEPYLEYIILKIYKKPLFSIEEKRKIQLNRKAAYQVVVLL